MFDVCLQLCATDRHECCRALKKKKFFILCLGAESKRGCEHKEKAALVLFLLLVMAPCGRWDEGTKEESTCTPQYARGWKLNVYLRRFSYWTSEKKTIRTNQNNPLRALRFEGLFASWCFTIRPFQHNPTLQVTPYVTQPRGWVWPRFAEWLAHIGCAQIKDRIKAADRQSNLLMCLHD